ncbi:MAG: PadR family transcriptional regulator [Anaerolineae bacterium]
MSPMVRQPLTTEHALLGFLQAGPMHGYQLYQQLTAARDLGLVWRLKESQLYRLLSRLEEAGYIEAVYAPQTSRPARRLLHLTDAGRAAFDAWVRAPVPHGRDLRLEFLAKLYFARQMGPGVVATLIGGQRTLLAGSRDDLAAEAEEIRSARPFDWLVLEFRLGQIRAMLDWLDVCGATMQSNSERQPT